MTKFNIGDKVFTEEQLTPGSITALFSSNDPDVIDMCQVQFASGAKNIYHVNTVSKTGPGAMSRRSILETATDIVTKDRNEAYGEPEDNFKDIAAMWSAYKGVSFAAHDVAAMMILLKTSRLKTSPENPDHWIDTAGYAACGGQAYSATEGT